MATTTTTTTALKRILVTGANKGIGKAICKKLLQDYDDTFVFLGSRDVDRGKTAVRSILTELGGSDKERRIDVVQVDVADDDSVKNAAAEMVKKCGEREGEEKPLYGIVNNAGMVSDDAAELINVNLFGVYRVCSVFMPLVKAGGRVVNVSSGAGPTYVNGLPLNEQSFFVSEDVSWDLLAATAKDFTSDDKLKAYSFSKACVNVLTEILAKQYPEYLVNGCTPGFIKTDLTAPYGATKEPEEGAVAPVFLLFDKNCGTGKYFGSDAVRSPLDKLREPGEPPYEP